ncbi:DsrE family protein [Wenyingzhuangia aestuarii]|uniref:DsrE family protein n=1 Tax=Wenyingzhuangia aestuarii TaxID=1647582 RepID=UPI0014387D78|nr:DsrE family protein [Wenyingzhuangia aestuarii]NJB82618.1 hypothetical protein [Wenyingzhuangia aestuarii]
MSKTAIIILADPKAKSEESLGRLFNALGAAWEHKQAKEDVKIIFQGTGTRWPEELENEKHPAYKLYKELEDVVEGASAACSQVWGANPKGIDLITNNPLPGTVGTSSFLKLQQDGYSILIF